MDLDFWGINIFVLFAHAERFLYSEIREVVKFVSTICMEFVINALDKNFEACRYVCDKH